MTAVRLRSLVSSLSSPWPFLACLLVFSVFQMLNVGELVARSSGDHEEAGVAFKQQEKRSRSLQEFPSRRRTPSASSSSESMSSSRAPYLPDTDASDGLLWPEMYTDILFFARIPKSGTENMVYLLKNLAGRNGFVHKRHPSPMPRRITEQAEKKQVAFILRHAKKTRPLSFDRHVYFIDFRRFGAKNPIYFSTLRDPVDKFISRFHYGRHPMGSARRNYDNLLAENSSHVAGLSLDEWRLKDIERCVMDADDECTIRLGDRHDLAIPYFCGQHDECMVVGSDWALQRAKENIERWFPVVAVLERMTQSAEVMEKAVPAFFAGASDLYGRELNEPHKNRRPKKKGLSAVAKAKLSTNLTHEYELYHFVNRRLSQQLEQVQRARIAGQEAPLTLPEKEAEKEEEEEERTQQEQTTESGSDKDDDKP